MARFLANTGGYSRTARRSSTGEETAEHAWTGSTSHPCFARFGTPSASYAYAGQGSQQVPVRYDDETFTQPTATVDGEEEKAMPKGKFTVAWPDAENRLLVANTPGASSGTKGIASNESTVWFSEAGNAEEWMTEGTAEHPEDNVELSPDDGSYDRAMARLRERELGSTEDLQRASKCPSTCTGATTPTRRLSRRSAS